MVVQDSTDLGLIFQTHVLLEIISSLSLTLPAMLPRSASLSDRPMGRSPGNTPISGAGTQLQHVVMNG